MTSARPAQKHNKTMLVCAVGCFFKQDIEKAGKCDDNPKGSVLLECRLLASCTIAFWQMRKVHVWLGEVGVKLSVSSQHL